MPSHSGGGLYAAFRKFLLIGGVGFMVDAVVLSVLAQLAGWPPWHARAISFPPAVLATWWLNRRYTFAGRGMQRRSAEAILYLAIQTCGLGLNLAAFGASLAHFPVLHRWPMGALMIGAGAGLCFNFVAAYLFLYSKRRARTHPASHQSLP
jgi:putative flippase GtrA